MFTFFFGNYGAGAATPLPDASSLVVYIRNQEATLAGFPSEWSGFDLLRFIGPPKGIVAVDFPGEIYPNKQLAPLFCRACYLDAAIYLATKAQDFEQVQRLRLEYRDVVKSLMGQVRAQSGIIERRFREGEAVG